MRYFFLLMFSGILFSCNQSDSSKSQGSNTKDSTKHDSVSVDHDSAIKDRPDTTTLLRLGREILVALKNKDYKTLVTYFDPEGVRFTPYTTVDSSDTKLTATQLLDLVKQNKKITWNNTDYGEDVSEPRTVNDYFKKFVYDKDYLTAKKVSINDFHAQTTAIINVKEFYPFSYTVEYFFSGFDKKAEGMDYRALRLVFIYRGGKNNLVGIDHCEWTP